MAETVDIRYIDNGTTGNDRYTAARVRDQQITEPHPAGGAVYLLRLDGGADEHGPVTSVLYAQVTRTLRRPVADDGVCPTCHQSKPADG